jgi:hypothetical protein
MLALPLFSMLACEAPPPPYVADLSVYTGAEAACLQAACAAATTAEAFAGCRETMCAATAEAWVVNPTLLRYDEGVVTMSVVVEHTSGQYGDIAAPAPGETWLGATVLTRDGGEIDMAVQTVFPDRLSEPFSFSAEVGPDVQDIIVGLWGKKIEPCDSTRSGCQMFGFVLDTSLAAWPQDTYVESPPRRQRFLPPALTVSVAAAPMSPERTAALNGAIGGFWTVEQERFGTSFTTTPWAPSAETTSVVLHRDAHDGPLASRVAGLLGAGVAVRHDPAAAADLALVLAATACPPGQECK